MGKYLKLFESHNEYIAFTQTENFIKPNVSHCIEENEVHYNPYDYSDRYLTFIAREDGTFKFEGNNIKYSIDDGDTWAELVDGTNTPTVTSGAKIMWKASGLTNAYVPVVDEIDEETGEPVVEEIGIGHFLSTSQYDVEGNIMSLVYEDDFIGNTNLTLEWGQFCYLFYNNVDLINAKNLSLPATTLSVFCYGKMFSNCTSLVSVPKLPATTLADGCYGGMFNGCTSLTTAPQLPATTLAQYCYLEMFSDCTSLTTAPELPATTLTDGCYGGMFNGCTSLTTAPELPAMTLADSCYASMFDGCTNLNYIKAMFTTTPSITYTSYWVNGVAASGTFVKNSAAQWNVTGNHGIPNGWTVVDAN